ncbi:uncharacterized protein SPPG_04564 [Spizellomyces punctatus DAOM BR117]|uniref:Transcription factor BYE1 n=1 Tax=Spizellomyces punctatus (strain DAOM BR117) TaxID=645134 RepID=A0A0L0HH72_SPIPD|nr:uncharacterized protein SPPG_04564 [Spizellomyces punctatus DAOM BR117]KND00230.1 hypothetical protein SPPG_04564 [Spizellomyces punctatus DAOM BR117]|eukprot:XP_016608269.1 hypothetical protein SPPG_04564 [Spizellomyces punctatus DAOM BR117]
MLANTDSQEGAKSVESVQHLQEQPREKESSRSPSNPSGFPAFSLPAATSSIPTCSVTPSETSLSTSNDGITSFEDTFSQFVDSMAPHQGPEDSVEGHSGHLENSDLPEVLNINHMDWEGQGLQDIFDPNTLQAPVDGANSLRLMNDVDSGSSRSIGDFTSQPTDSGQSLSWPTEHALLDEMSGCEATDAFPLQSSFDDFTLSGSLQQEKTGGSVNQDTSAFTADTNDGMGSTAPAHEIAQDDRDAMSETTNGEVLMSAVESFANSADAAADRPVPHVSDADMISNAPTGLSSKAPASQANSTPSTPTVERRVTRGKAPVNYKALLDGPSITSKLIPPKKPTHNQEGERVYCMCREPDYGKFMIQCDNCEEWFHGKCVGLTKKAGEKLTTYHCPLCQELLGSANASQTNVQSTTAQAMSPNARGGRRSSVLAVIPRHNQTHAMPSSVSHQNSASSGVRSATASSTPARRKERSVDVDRFYRSNASPVTQSIKCSFGPCTKAPIPNAHFCSADCARSFAGTAPPLTCLNVACTNSSQKGSRFCGQDCEKLYAEQQERLMIASRQAAATAAEKTSPKPPPTPAWMNDPVRKMARKNFEETLSTIFTEAREHPEVYGGLLDEKIDLEDPKAFAAQLETELFDALATPIKGDPKGTLECGAPYKSKYRSLQFNLKDQRNLRLRRRVLCGDVTLHELVRLPPEDLGNDEVKAAAEEIRRRSLRDALRVNTDQISYVKKTHKGEIEVVRPVVQGPAGGSMNLSTASIAPKLTTDEDTQVEKPSRSESPLVEQKSPGSIEHLGDVQSTEAMDVSRVEATSTAEKRSGSNQPEDEERVSKKLKTGAKDVVPEDESPNATPPETPKADEYDPYEPYYPDSDNDPPREELVLEGDAAGEDYEYDPETADSMELDMPFVGSPQPDVDPDATVWRGRVHMPQIGKFTGTCKQVCGRTIGDVKTWEDILPATISIDGRVAVGMVEKYLREQRYSGGKQVVAVEFRAGEDEPSLASPDDQNGFGALFDYFQSRSRLAVVGHHYVSIKDMYIVPIGRNDSIPGFIQELDDCRVEPTPRDRDILLGVIILAKGFTGSGSSKSSSDSAGHAFNGARKKSEETNLEKVRPPEIISSIPATTSMPAILPAVQPLLVPSVTPLNKPSLLDTLAPLPSGPSTTANPPPLAGTQPPMQLSHGVDTTSLLTTLLSNPNNLGLVTNLLSQLTQPGTNLPMGNLNVGNLLGALNGGLGGVPPPTSSQQQTQHAGLGGLLGSLGGGLGGFGMPQQQPSIPGQPALNIFGQGEEQSRLGGRNGRQSRWDRR